MNLDKYTQKSLEALKAAQALALERGSMEIRLMFSLPKPLAIARIWTLSPGAIDRWRTAGQLSSVFFRSYRGSETMDLRK